MTRNMTLAGAEKPALLIADDERNTREAMARGLRRRFEITLAEDGLQAIRWLQQQKFDLVLSDLRMPGADGMQVLEATKQCAEPPLCILLSAYGTVESAVQAVKEGAFDFVVKPVNFDRLELLLDRALETRKLQDENLVLQRQLQQRKKADGDEMIVAHSEVMHHVMEMIDQVAPSRATVLLTGESGTGKEVMAHALHRKSGRSGKFIAIHCAALPSTLLESELFGHEKGAFTGAVDQKKGRFELAQGGTLFLDEIGEIDASTQVKLLRVLESRVFERLGGSEEIKSDARLVVATNRDLEAMVHAGTFREDLFYRLNVVAIHLPPLRARREDIDCLAERFLQQFATENDREGLYFQPDVLEAMRRYDWPGNIRELRNTVERMVVLSRHQELELADLPGVVRQSEFRPDLQRYSGEGNGDGTGYSCGVGSGAGSGFGSGGEGHAAMPDVAGKTLAEQEKELIARTLQECGNNRSLAAEKLGISRRTLYRRLEEYGIEEKIGKNE